MLPDQVTELLTAFVDGELGQRQRKVVLRLLHRSSEARELVRQLQENAHKVKQLPRRKVEPSLVNEVLQAIAEQQAQPVQPLRRKVARRHWMPYFATALAASLLLGAVGLLYWKSLGQPEGPTKEDGPVISKNTPPQKKNEPRPLEREIPPVPKPANPLLARVVEGTFGGFGAPTPVEQIFTASFRDLQKDGVATGQLVNELNRDKVVKLDIKVKNNPLAMERLKMALNDLRIKIIVDTDAEKSLKKKNQAKAQYVVYAENLTTEEVAKMLKDLSLNDTTGKVSSVPSPYEKVTVTPLAKNEKSQVANTLGIDLSKMEKETKGGTPPNASRQRSAVVLPVSAGAQPSVQVQQFAKERRRPQPGTVQLLIKIHQD